MNETIKRILYDARDEAMYSHIMFGDYRALNVVSFFEELIDVDGNIICDEVYAVVSETLLENNSC